MVQGVVRRRISKLTDTYRPNDFYAALSAELDVALENSTAPRAEALAQVYVCERVSGYSDAGLTSLIDRMPPDIQALAQREGPVPPTVGSYEMRVVDFLLATRPNRLLCILGRVGVGKSTFLAYIFQNLRNVCPSLRRFVPIFLNGSSFLPERKDAEWVRVLSESIRARAEDPAERAVLDIDAVNRLLERLASKQASDDKSRFIDAVRDLKKACIGGAEPVIIFDNLDHLKTDAVLRISVLARTLQVNTELCVITALRPAMLSAQREEASGGGAFLLNFIELTAPDLRSVISRRVRKAFCEYKSVRASNERGLAVQFDDPEASLNSLAAKVLDLKTQDALWQLSNYNVRVGLTAFKWFCSYRQLDYSALLDLQTNVEHPEHVLHRDWLDHFIEGVMIGTRDHFRDSYGPVANIYFLKLNDGHSPDYAILRWCLLLLDWVGGTLDRDVLVEWLGSLGYDESIANSALRHLKERMLVEFSNSEHDLRPDSLVIRQATGRYHLRELASHPLYLKNAVFDTPLPHAEWREGSEEGFSARLHSIQELMDVVYESEYAQVQRLLAHKAPPPQLLGAIGHLGLLTHQLISGAHGLLPGAYKSRSSRTREKAKKLSEHMASVRMLADALQDKVKREVARRAMAPGDPTQSRTLQAVLSGPNSIQMIVPRKIAPADENRVELEVGLPGMYRDLPIVALWRGRNDTGATHQEIARLTWVPKREKFCGEFVISDVESIMPFPKSTMTIFADADPILVTSRFNSQA